MTPSVTFRFLKEKDIPILKDLVYEAIFIPEGVEPPPRDIIEKPEIDVYIRDFGSLKDDCCILTELDGSIAGGVWVGYDLYDAAISVMTLHHYNRQIKTNLYRKIYNSLKTNGVYIECDYMLSEHEYENPQVSKWKTVLRVPVKPLI